jgi:hypothetical protein
MRTSTSLLRIGSLASTILLTTPGAYGAAPTKEECLQAHSVGQDAREAGKFARAGELFLTCAQPACPTLVQSDCARFADELGKLQPTVTFAARDSAQNDLLDASVFVDGTLVAAHLGDGKAYEIDPGRHEVRFVHEGKETVLMVVVNQGEKGRGIVGIFTLPPEAPPAPVGSAALIAARRPASVPKRAERARPAGPLVLAGLGGVAAVAGGVLLGVGLRKIPSRCSLSTKECAATPNDPVLDQASSGVTMANAGGIIAAGGVLTLAGSLIWYFAQTPGAGRRNVEALLPWAAPNAAGVSFAGLL